MSHNCFSENIKNQEERIDLELGEESSSYNVKNKVWVESPTIVEVIPTSSGIKFKTKSLGITRVRLDQSMLRIHVVPPQFKKALIQWKKLVYRFASLKIDTVNQQPCLGGQIHHINEFKKLYMLLEKEKAVIYVCVQLNSELKIEVQQWFQEKFRQNQLPPLVVEFNQIWKVHIPQNLESEKKDILSNQFGLFVSVDKKNVALDQNIKVDIYIVELRKHFSQKLGIQYPSEYTAQILPQESKYQLEPFLISAQAQEKNGDLKVLASPNLICRNNKEADFFAGGEFPLLTQSKDNKQVVHWKKYGITLKIKPLIDSAGQMSLEIETEISSIDFSMQVQGIPALNSYKVKSHFDLVESRTIALSGLIKNEQGKSTDGIPGLQKIPILGKLFSSNEFVENKTELVIFVTPQLMR